MNAQCQECTKNCIGKTDLEKVCNQCIYNNKKHYLKECIDCGIKCQFTSKIKKSKSTSCQICNSGLMLQEHHLMRGVYRDTADQHGYTIIVCDNCHKRIHSDRELELSLRQQAERRHIEKYGREDYLKKFGKITLEG